jgi:hypothetical protein
MHHDSSAALTVAGWVWGLRYISLTTAAVAVIALITEGDWTTSPRIAELVVAAARREFTVRLALTATCHSLRRVLQL